MGWTATISSGLDICIHALKNMFPTTLTCRKVVCCSTLRLIFQLVCKSLFLLFFGSSASIFYSRPRRIQAQVTRAAVESLKPHRFQRRNWPAQLYAMSSPMDLHGLLAIAGEAGWLFCRSKSPKKMEKPGRGHSTATPRNQMADATLTLHPDWPHN